jgi:hypothetical protein
MVAANSGTSCTMVFSWLLPQDIGQNFIHMKQKQLWQETKENQYAFN